ncbi:MAG TPA: hypothetical protein VHS05_22740 [Pyrinomonadaceae bacterium]|nr:hypothetical protein [Pyrinomonadaceae bacterium]
MNRTKELLIIDAWKPLDKEVVGASELGLIRESIVERFGADVSPASIARALADHGARLGHPEILQADVRWRESNLCFTPEDLTIDTLEDATALMEKLENLRGQLEKPQVEQLYYQVRQLKSELELMPTSLGQELAQWLTIWLQNPQIFAEWLDLRRATKEFRARFEL